MLRPALDRAILFPYDTAKYDFHGVVTEDVYGVPDLSQLHRYWLSKRRAENPEARLSYPDNLALRAVLQKQGHDSRFYKLYRRFVHNELAPFFGGRIRYTMHPKCRVHLARTEGVSNWHVDVEYTGRHEQVNAWMPFTDAYDTATLWSETDYCVGDHQPVDVMYGEVLLFDGGYLSHGTVPNRTNVTRVSIDFRFNAKRADLHSPDRGILAGRPSGIWERIAGNRAASVSGGVQ